MNAELKELVDMSNVETVRSAIAAKYEAEKNARRQIDECRQNAASDISTAKADARSAIEESRKAVADIKKNMKTAWISFLCILICCLISARAFWLDLWRFINMPIDYASHAIDAISSDPDGSSFALNVFLCVLIHLPYLLFAYILYKLIRFYLKNWCGSSFWVLMISFIFIVALGDLIKGFLNWNLIILFFLVQIIYTIVLGYMDICKPK